MFWTGTPLDHSAGAVWLARMLRWPSGPGTSISRGDPLRLARADRSGGEGGGLPVEFSAPVTDHAASDDAGVGTLGEESTPFWRDHMGAGVNAIRTQTLIRAADVVVVRFGDKYRQWNAAFDAGYAAALGKPIVTLHDAELDHALKEVDRAAQATARTRRAGRRRPPLRDRRQAALTDSRAARPLRIGSAVGAEANSELIERFYAAFDRCDGAAMTACYAPDAHFRDPAFGDLEGDEIGAMWRMLTGRATDLKIELPEHEAGEDVRLGPLDRPLHLLHGSPGGQRHPRQVPLRRRPDRRPRRRLRLPQLGEAGAGPDAGTWWPCCRRCARRHMPRPAASSTSSSPPSRDKGFRSKLEFRRVAHANICSYEVGRTASRERSAPAGRGRRDRGADLRRAGGDGGQLPRGPGSLGAEPRARRALRIQLDDQPVSRMHVMPVSIA